jgi:ATP adenylyltransferase
VTNAQDERYESGRILWAPWRMRYIEAEKPDDCIFCTPTDESAQRLRLILAVTTHARILLNKYPYNNGHLLIAPHQHTGILGDIPAAAFLDLMTTLRWSIDVVERVLQPQGVNVGLNLGVCAGAGITDHVHWHVVPRWTGDTNFMPVLSTARVMPQHLLESYDRLRPYFASPPPAVENLRNQREN